MKHSEEPLSDTQRRQVDAIALLLLQADRASITQGVELATALDDQAVFAALLAGVQQEAKPEKKVSNRRFPTLGRGEVLTPSNVGQVWVDLATAHLLAASNIPLRDEVTSLALGGPKKPLKPEASLWIDGLERLPSLTHLDLFLPAVDRGIDLGGLRRFPCLAHLRLRGPGIPGPLPPLEHLETLQATNVEIDPDAAYPALRSVKARLHGSRALRQSNVPNLAEVQVRGGVTLNGFGHLQKLVCNGDVDVGGCTRVRRLRFIRGSLHAPELRHIGELIGAPADFDLDQIETLEAVQLSRVTKFSGGAFPAGTRLLHPKIAFWGPTLTDLGNVGELPGLETLHLVRVAAPISLETLRHARSLRLLDIRNSPGITDLSPLVGLRNLKTIMLSENDKIEIPDEMAHKIERASERVRVRRLSASEQER